MPATLDQSPAPTSAILVWHDGLRIYAKIGDYITHFPLTEGGLSKVLSLIPLARYDYSAPSLRVEPTTLIDAQVQSLLRKHGII